jgi:hypothetical protein
MLKSEYFSEGLEEVLKHFPERNRRWDVSLFRSQPNVAALKAFSLNISKTCGLSGFR